ncbi:electron transport complex subunit RsxC [Sesbania bispinosa]|nr:electron transport complex subunit RsxC [Sesbania bispinosa]
MNCVEIWSEEAVAAGSEEASIGNEGEEWRSERFERLKAKRRHRGNVEWLNAKRITTSGKNSVAAVVCVSMSMAVAAGGAGDAQ